MRFAFSIIAALIASAVASNVLDLSEEADFEKSIGQGVPALVEFFAPWCGHCKNLAPIYEQLADAFAHAKDKVIIAKVDADGAGKALGKKYGVTGFPTLKWVDGSGKEENYESGRDLDSLAAFISKKSGVKSNIKPPPPSSVKIVDVGNFKNVVLQEDINVLVSFTAPWCGHCKSLKPIYEKVATTFLPETDCLVTNFDADDQKNKDIARQYDVSGYPTLKFFGRYNKDKPEVYEGPRTEEALVEFLNKKCGKHRAVGGGLNEKAGTNVELDDVTQRFMKAEGEHQKKLFGEANRLALSVGPTSDYYIKVMAKIVVDGDKKYAEKENARLNKILKKRALHPDKLDDIRKKINVLQAFVKPEDSKSNETIARVEAEL